MCRVVCVCVRASVWGGRGEAQLSGGAAITSVGVNHHIGLSLDCVTLGGHVNGMVGEEMSQLL